VFSTQPTKTNISEETGPITAIGKRERSMEDELDSDVKTGVCDAATKKGGRLTN
jgi:hypothetical protein